MARTGERPRIELPLTTLDIAMEVVAAVSLAALVLIAVRCIPELPDRVATHFGFNGKPDAWGAKEALWIIPGVGVVLYALLTTVARFPHIFNYPVAITPANAERQYRIGVETMRWLKAEILVLFVQLEWQTIQVGAGRADGLAAWTAPALIVVILLTAAVQIVRAVRAR